MAGHIDEQMIPYRGRVGFRQFVANKPKRFGIKVWAMADATNKPMFCSNKSTLGRMLSKEHLKLV